MSSNHWHKGFPEFSGSPKTLTELLSSGELPEDKYLAWATEEYKIPLLASDFFNSVKNFNLLLDHSSYQWKDNFFPVNEWNGILYIACLEPQEFKYKNNYCFVLGSYKSMKSLWGKLEQPLEASVVIDALEFSEATLLRNLRSPDYKEPTAVSHQAPLEKTSAQGAQKTLPESPAIAGLSFSNLKTADSSDGTNPPPVETQKKPDDALSRSNINISPKFTSTKYTLPKEFVKELAEEKVIKKEEKEITNVAKIPSPAARRDVTFTATKTIMPFPERTSQFTFTRTIYSSQVILEAEAKIKDNKDPQQALLSAFKILQDYYKKLMWVVRDQKGYAYPIACNAEWDFTEEAWNEPMAFKHPNPFRIAKLTQKPYHGPVFPSPATDKYFKLWNNGHKPDFFTVVPIMMYGKVFGYLVGCEKGPHFDKNHSLEIMEIAGKELLETFINIHHSLNKAA